MKIIPEISIMNGYCVKREGRNQRCPDVISHSPVTIAREWEEQGASMIQLRDADSVFERHIVNHETIQEVLTNVTIPVFVCGGICSVSEVESLLALGVAKAVFRTSEDVNLRLLKETVHYFGAEKTAVSMQVEKGILDARPEAFHSSEVIDSLKQILDLGITSIDYENNLEAQFLYDPNFRFVLDLVEEHGLNFTVSGNIQNLKELESAGILGVQGVILGDALYEKRIELKHAIELFDKGEGQDGR